MGEGGRMNVVITAMGLGTSASPCEYAIERTIRRCIDDGMLGEVPTQQLDVEVSFDDAESGGIPEAFKSEFAEDHETALDRRVHMSVTITWTTTDIQDVYDLDDEAAEAFLAKARRALEDRSISIGWEVFDDLAAVDGVTRLDELEEEP